MIIDLRVGAALLKARVMLNRIFAEGEAVRLAVDWRRVHFFDPAGPGLDLAFGAE